MVKQEKRAIKVAAKKERFETGKYNFIERVGLVFKFIFSPITKLNEVIKNGLNKRLKEREARLIINKKEKDHKLFLKSIAEEDRREKELFDVEKRIEKERQEVELLRKEKAVKDDQKKKKLDKELQKIEKEKAEIKAQEEQEKLEEDAKNNEEVIEEKEIEELKSDDQVEEKQEEIVEKSPPKKSSKTKK